MKLISYLNKSLKSEELIELFETNDVDVIYTYDRNYEGRADEYIGSIRDLGLQFIFNETQILSTIFIYIKDEEFLSANLESLGLSTFDSKNNLMKYAQQNSLKYFEGRAVFFGQEREWLKLDFLNYTVHYEFREDSLSLVTLQSKNA